jgi:hypothetical protein
MLSTKILKLLSVIILTGFLTKHITAQSRVGINEINPQATLDVKGSFRMQSPNAAAGKVLTSDSAGFATWQTASGVDTNWYRNLQNKLVANSSHIAIGTENASAPLTVYSDTSTTVAKFTYEGSQYADQGIVTVNHVNGTIEDHIGVFSSVKPGDYGGYGISYRGLAGYVGAYLTASGSTPDIVKYGLYSETYGGNGIGVGAYALGGGPLDTQIGTDAYAAGGLQNIGVDAYSATDIVSDSAIGLRATVTGSGNNIAILASATGVNSKAARFVGNVDVVGNLTKSGGTFKIDHPQDPGNKYLIHSFVESPDMMNVYNGNITTSSNGEAVVKLPTYFEAENKDFRYQLTVIGKDARVYVLSKITNNQFIIKSSEPNTEVSWQVTGVRNDAWAKANRVVPEVNKSEQEAGKYLHPELYTHAVGIDIIPIKTRPNFEANLKAKNKRK